MSDPVLIALIGAIGLSMAALLQARSTHKLINSRMDELLIMARSQARAEGVAAGEQAQRDRQNPPQD